jgi:WD40 repeat protein
MLGPTTLSRKLRCIVQIAVLSIVGWVLLAAGQRVTTAYQNDKGSRYAIDSTTPSGATRVKADARGNPLLNLGSELAPSIDVPVKAGLNFGFTFSSDGSLLATASFQDVRIYKTEKGDEVPGLKHKRDALTVAFSPNGKYIVTGTNVEITTDEAPGIWIWDAVSKSRVRNLPLDAHAIGVKFSPSGRYLAVAGFAPNFGDSKDFGAWVWEWNDGNPQKVLFRKTDQTRAYSVAISSDDKYVVVAGGFNTQLFELATNKQIFNGPWSRSAVFSPDGKYMAMANDDSFTSNLKAATVWKIDEKKVVARLVAGDEVRSVAFSPDGKFLATGGDDKYIRVWDWSKGQEVMRIVQESSVLIVAFDPKGKYLAAGIDGHVRIWRWPAN